MSKRKKTYAQKLTLKEGVEFDDLINLAMKPNEVKKVDTNRKRAVGKKK